jgi:hypothetical protein
LHPFDPSQILLNNIDVSCDYVLRLSREIDAQASRVFKWDEFKDSSAAANNSTAGAPVGDQGTKFGAREMDRQRTKVRTCLNGLTDVSSVFRRGLQSGLEGSFTAGLRPRLGKAIAEILRDCAKYHPTDEEFVEMNNADDAGGLTNGLGFLARRLAADFEKSTELTRKYLTHPNFEKLVVMSGEYISKEWERFLFGCKFNQVSYALLMEHVIQGGSFPVQTLIILVFGPFALQLGANRFDRDLRGVMNYMSSLTQVAARDKFARLAQMAILLNMEKVIVSFTFWGVFLDCSLTSSWFTLSPPR